MKSLFDINGYYGRGAYALPEFPDADSLISHMDYLKIDRCLVNHVESRDLSPSWGNHKLLDELAGCEIRNRRLIPCFTVTPSMVFELGALEELCKAFDNNAVKALRLFPATSRFAVRHVERLFAEIAAYNPVVLIDYRELGDRANLKELIDLAAEFPEMTFILTEMMWPAFGDVLDAMWRRDNICTDISWLHMRDAIELLVENFGVERVFFGTGHKSHYGAAIAALAYANITDNEREMIAHENIEKLLGLDPPERSLVNENEVAQKKALWQCCRNGEILDDLEIIDAHSHTGPHSRGWYMREWDLEENVPNLIQHMDRIGINRMLICPEHALFGPNKAGNEIGEEALAPHADRFSGYLVFNPIYAEEMEKALDDFFSRDFFVGFKVLAGYWKIPLTDERFHIIYRYADKHRLPILFHTWQGSFDSPAMLTDVAPKYPNAIFLLGHSGGGDPGRIEAEKLANDNPNVYLEFCGSFTASIPFEESIRKVGAEKVVFGSDGGAHNVAWELGRLLSLPMPDELLKSLLAENIKRILAKRER